MPGGPPMLGFSMAIYTLVGLLAWVAVKWRGRR